MCGTCGCSDDSKFTVFNLQTGKHVHIGDHDHDHAHEHEHEHNHVDLGHPHAHADLTSERATAGGRTILLEEKVLAKNDHLAEHNRAYFDAHNILAVNIVSSPGAGKTTLLERTIFDLKSRLKLSVIEGDQATLNDSQRIKATGVDVVQINTAASCHLDAATVAAGVKQLHPEDNSVILIENVGNLVCPALFDLGEKYKVAILSVTEGEDKPVKYPYMFRAAQVLILNKVDLLPYLEFDLEACKNYALAVNPNLKIMEVSATKGEGLSDWYDWIIGCLSDNSH